jgi:hypothetical protein
MRVLTITLQVEDAEFAAFLSRISERGTVAGLDNGGDGGIEPGDQPAGNAAVDSRGVPWLDGIHAKTKTFTKDGRWRSSKGVSDQQRDAAEKPYLDQIAASRAGQQPTFQVPAAIAGGQPVNLPNPDFHPGQPQGGFTLPGGGLPAMPQPTGFPGGLPQLPQQQPDVPVSYDDISRKYDQLVSIGKANPETMFAIYRKHGIVDPTMLVNDESLRRKVITDMNTLG